MDLWTTASEDTEAQHDEERTTAARLALAPVWAFLASATSPTDYSNRKAIAAEQIDSAVRSVAPDAQEFIALRSQAEAMLDEDFDLVLSARQRETARVEAQATRARVEAENQRRVAAENQRRVAAENQRRVAAENQRRQAVFEVEETSRTKCPLCQEVIEATAGEGQSLMLLNIRQEAHFEVCPAKIASRKTAEGVPEELKESDPGAKDCTACDGNGTVPDGEGDIKDCEQCGGTGEAEDQTPKEGSRKTASERYQKAKQVLEQGIYSGPGESLVEIDGALLDAQTANLMVQVYEALSTESQAKFDSIPLDRLIPFLWKQTRSGSRQPRTPHEIYAALSPENQAKAREMGPQAFARFASQVIGSQTYPPGVERFIDALYEDTGGEASVGEVRQEGAIWKVQVTMPRYDPVHDGLSGSTTYWEEVWPDGTRVASRQGSRRPFDSARDECREGVRTAARFSDPFLQSAYQRLLDQGVGPDKAAEVVEDTYGEHEASKTAETHAPYRIQESGDGYKVVNDIGETKGTHDTYDEAREHQKALYVNVEGAPEQAERKSSSMRKGAPFAGYEDFDACVRANQDKDDPSAYCGKIKHETEGSRRQANPYAPDGNRFTKDPDPDEMVYPAVPGPTMNPQTTKPRAVPRGAPIIPDPAPDAPVDTQGTAKAMRRPRATIAGAPR